LPPGCSKGTALDCVARQRGLRREQVMAIGDNLNDLDMLEYAGHPVVMANANAEVLALAEIRGWQRTASNDDDGVALAIEALLYRQGNTPDYEGNPSDEVPGSSVVEFAQ
jgi:hydroxymethylpyrimidine pyrophosphatase-like HAD family hydrolase